MSKFARKMEWIITLGLAALMIGALLALPTQAATVNWTGASGADLFWATPGNWSAVLDGASDVVFDAVGAVPLTVPPTVTNEVTASTAINSLWYSQQDTVPIVPVSIVHTTKIDPGQTLSITGVSATAPPTGANGNLSLYAGTSTGTTSTSVSQTILNGGGNLDVSNTSSDILVRVTNGTNGEHRAILNLSGLAKFTANVDQLLVGYTSVGSQRPLGTMYLAQSNTITLNNTSNTGATPINAGLVVGYAQNTANTGVSYLYLGQSNEINAQSVNIGGRRMKGMMMFNQDFSSPSVTMRGIAGGDSRVQVIAIGDNYENGAANIRSEGTMDLRGGTANIKADSIILGRTWNTASTGTGNTDFTSGILYFNAGTIDTTSMSIGVHPADNYSPARGTVEVSGTGNLLVGSGGIAMATYVGTTFGSATGTLNINGGMVTLGGDITDGGGTSNIAMTGGLLDMAAHLVGSPSASINTITLANSVLDNIFQINAGTLTINSSVTLDVSLGAIVPVNNDVFDILNWTTLSGTFSTVTLPALSPGLSWKSDNLYVDGTIQVIPEPATVVLLLMGAVMLFVLRRR